MLADRTQPVPADPTTVNLEGHVEVEYWSAQFSVTPDALRACVAEVGSRAEDVQARLRKAAHDSFTKGGED